MWDTIIIGGGPAGLTASIYVGRAEKRVLIIDNDQTLLKKAPKIENYLGFPSISC